MSFPLQLDLLDNALDSLVQGIQFALEDPPQSKHLKLAILLTAQAIELALKERLRREHWSLIWRRLDQAGDDDKPTVSTQEAITRLDKIAKVHMCAQAKQIVERLARTRNRLQHYEITLSYEEALGRIHGGIAFLTEFLHSELQIDLRDKLTSRDIENLLAVEEIVAEFRRIAGESVEELERENMPFSMSDRAAWHFEVIECPNCWEEFYVLSVDSNLSRCQLCKYEGGFVECDRCGLIRPSGDWEFHSESEGHAICERCWEYMYTD